MNEDDYTAYTPATRKCRTLNLWNIMLYSLLAGLVLATICLPVVIFSTGLAEADGLSEKNTADIIVASGLQGNMVGKVTPQGGMFWGIPFSQPPTGDFRWKKPRLPTPFSDGVWNATYHRPGCPQTCSYKSAKFTCPSKTDEDCLYLNVWLPRTVLVNGDRDDVVEEPHYVIGNEFQSKSEKSLPVMVYLHGGNYVYGSGSAIIYDGRFLAEQGDVIIVTTNYRLGALGFLVQGDGPDAAMGNFGIWDQIRALEWVRDNIEFFGGNPEKVTVFGQSSGAESVGVLMASPHATGLFHRAIISSDPLALPLRDVAGAKTFGAKFARALQCEPGNMTCLRNANVSAILKAANINTFSLFGTEKKLLSIQPWGPVVDGDFLIESPLDAFQHGHAARIPVIMGVTADEGMFFVPLAINYKLSTIFYNFAVAALVGTKSDAVLKHYPSNCESNCDNRYQVSDIITDYVFVCPTRHALQSQIGKNDEAWFYVFNQTLPFTGLWESDMCNDKSCHCADLPFVFDTVDLAHEFEFSADDKLLARRIGYYWTNFAKYGNPNGQGEFINTSHHRESHTQGEYNANYWPRFGDANYGLYSAIEMKSEGDVIISQPYEKICNFWDGLESYGAFR